MAQGVETRIEDTREIKVPVPASDEDTATFTSFVCDAQAEGYRLHSAAAIETGQRDPITVAVRLTFKRIPR